MAERKSYTYEFKREVVQLCAERGNVTAVARDLGLDHKLLRAWMKQLAAEVFFGACEREFAFLSEYGFRRPRKESHSRSFSWDTYNKTTALTVSLDRRDQVIDAEIIRNVDGRPPGRFGNLAYYFPLRILGQSHSGSRRFQTDSTAWPLQPDDIRRIVGEYAAIVKELGTDALRGDFSDLQSRETIK